MTRHPTRAPPHHPAALHTRNTTNRSHTTMNKAALVAAIHDRIDVNKTTIGAVLDSLAAVITKHLASGDAGIEREATLPGLGKLKTTDRAARTGRNPHTGAPIQIPARTAVRFVASKPLGDALNQ